MATRSAIGHAVRGKVTGVYCHNDGYPEHHAPILLKYYDTAAKVKKLLTYGNMSILAQNIGEKHDFQYGGSTHPEWCLFYGRDRGEENQDAKVFPSLEAFENCFNASDYFYFFYSGRWLYKRSGGEIYTFLDEVQF